MGVPAFMVGAAICDVQVWLCMTEAVFGEFWSVTGVVFALEVAGVRNAGIFFKMSRSMKFCERADAQPQFCLRKIGIQFFGTKNPFCFFHCINHT